MKKHLLRNIGWIALLAVWSFLAGAYFHLGWVRDYSMNFRISFVIGGIAIWTVFIGMGILVYKFAKKQKSVDPVKPALFVVSFFTVCFLLIAWIKYDEVQIDKFVEDLESDFVLHYTHKAEVNGLEIDQIVWELQGVYTSIQHQLKRHEELEKLMKLNSANAVFEENDIIARLCLDQIQLESELGYPPPKGFEILFE